MNGLKPYKEALGLWEQELQGAEGREVMSGTCTLSMQKTVSCSPFCSYANDYSPLRSSQPLEE